MFCFQQEIGNGLGSGELTPKESQNFVAKLDNLRREDYTVLQEGKNDHAGGMGTPSHEAGRSGEEKVKVVTRLSFPESMRQGSRIG